MKNIIFTKEQIKKLEEVFGIDGSIAEACYYAAVSESDYNIWLLSNDDYRETFEMLRNKSILQARQEVVKGFKDDPDFALKYLERKRRKEFGTQHNIDHTTNNKDLPSPILMGIINKDES